MGLFVKGRVFIVAEVGLQHCGCLGTALTFIDACAKAGVDAVKFQDHRGDPNNSFRDGCDFPQDASRKVYWDRTGFDRRGWERLKSTASFSKLAFGLSPFSMEAASQHYGDVDFWKVGSGQIANTDLLHFVARRAKPVIISTGMAGTDEIIAAANILGEHLADFAFLQCTSRYPSKPEAVGLNVIRQLNGYAPFVGLSDHSGTIYPSLAAATLGADVVEVHVCWDKRQWGPDVSSSITIDQLAQLVEGVRFIEKMRANPVDKDAMAERLKETRAMFMGGKA